MNNLSRTVLLAITALSLISFGANAETVTYLGRSINLDPPPGFCQLNSSPEERALFEYQRRNTEPAGELAQFAVPCTELADVRALKADRFTRWVQVLVLKRKGQLLPVSAPRTQFVRGLAGHFADTPLDVERLSRRANKHLAQTNTAVTDFSYEPLGTTQDAFFTRMKMMAQVGTVTSPVSAIAATTVVNQLPIGVYAFGTPKAKGEPAIETTRAYLRQILDRN
ncbi:hypothetical protein [Methylibium petroleiphilum]|uniref:hypothetical protein n=1 Tax=Methylibium petroleiphilum TaxID=105560 RepID=UPI000DD2BB3E